VSALISPRSLVRVIAYKQTPLLEQFESDSAFEPHTLDRSSVPLSRTGRHLCVSDRPRVLAIILRLHSDFFCVLLSFILTVMTFSSPSPSRVHTQTGTTRTSPRRGRVRVLPLADREAPVEDALHLEQCSLSSSKLNSWPPSRNRNVRAVFLHCLFHVQEDPTLHFGDKMLVPPLPLRRPRTRPSAVGLGLGLRRRPPSQPDTRHCRGSRVLFFVTLT
jgi:hypothetical protein